VKKCVKLITSLEPISTGCLILTAKLKSIRAENDFPGMVCNYKLEASVAFRKVLLLPQKL
jgi:hypothetical protein